jgi:rhamnose utilization protein RhaD (predicted bifunctional aldolase and dehydrogenase)
MEQVRLAELQEHSVFVGSNPDLVQASGGNTSWKNGSTIWVKGSGKRLKDALAEDIFATINFEALTQNEIADSQDFSSQVLNSTSPSIESNFHILIKNNFVTHLHSLGSISISISSENVRSKISESGISFVPYRRPGVDLAKAILKTDRFQENILVLQNHGVIFSGSSCSQIEKKIKIFESTIKNLFETIAQEQVFPNWVEILVSGVLTPDQAVFLGRKPFVESEISTTESVSINSKGELLFPEKFSQDRIDMASFYVRLAKLIEKKTHVTYLPIEEVEAILGWDKEKNRIAMAK